MILESTFVKQGSDDSSFIEKNRSFARGTDISHECDEIPITRCLEGQCIIDDRMREFLCSNIVDRYTIPIGGWTEKEDIPSTNELCLKDETGTQVFTTDDILGAVRWDSIVKRIVAIWIFIRSVREELSREFRIHITLDEDTIVEEIRICLSLSNLYALQKWLLVETKFIESSSIRIGNHRKDTEERDEEKSFHRNFERELSNLFEFFGRELVLVSRIE